MLVYQFVNICYPILQYNSNSFSRDTFNNTHQYLFLGQFCTINYILKCVFCINNYNLGKKFVD